jgi:hypothetical protein
MRMAAKQQEQGVDFCPEIGKHYGNAIRTLKKKPCTRIDGYKG